METSRRWLAIGAVLVGAGVSIATSSYSDWSVCGAADGPGVTLDGGGQSVSTSVTVTTGGLEDYAGEASLTLEIEVSRTLIDGSPDLVATLRNSAGESVDTATLAPDDEAGLIAFYGAAGCPSDSSEGCELEVELSAVGDGSMIVRWWVQATLEDSGAEQNDDPGAFVDVVIEGGTSRDCAAGS